jgi:hypothetical protein
VSASPEPPSAIPAGLIAGATEELRTATALVTLAAGVIDERLPAAARLSRRTLSVVTATSNGERVPETPP